MILSREPVLRIDEHILGSQGSLLHRVAAADLKDLERQHILQTLTLTNWRIEGPNGAAVSSWG